MPDSFLPSIAFIGARDCSTYESQVARCYAKELAQYGIEIESVSISFPMRNRLIAGLSDGIFVVEAREKSGTLITVDRGLEQGKDIYSSWQGDGHIIKGM